MPCSSHAAHPDAINAERCLLCHTSIPEVRISPAWIDAWTLAYEAGGGFLYGHRKDTPIEAYEERVKASSRHLRPMLVDGPNRLGQIIVQEDIGFAPSLVFVRITTRGPWAVAFDLYGTLPQ